MKTNSFHVSAAAELMKAYEEAKMLTAVVSCQHNAFVDAVIDNTHLTYKYILFTALLAKTTDASLDALSLQATTVATVGAYDARSLCHKVIVPFEQKVLNRALGESNEPFLNKPARFPKLAKTNAVRRGNDEALRDLLIDMLPLFDKSTARILLVNLLYKLRLIAETKIAVEPIADDENEAKRMAFYDAILPSRFVKGSTNGLAQTPILSTK